MVKKRILTLVMAAALLISGVNYTEEVKAADLDTNKAAISSDKPEIKEEVLKEEEDKKVRVIVELEGESLLDEANKKNIDYSSLSENFVEEKKGEINSEQAEVVSEIKNSEIEADVSDIRSYSTILNGIALNVKAKDVEKLDGIRGVKSVYISEEFERPLLTSSNEMTGSAYAGGLNYKGEGTVVAVIDSGIDYNHRAFTLDNESRARLTESDVNRLIAEKGLGGRYYTSKIPYGYNYYDFNTNLYDSYGVMHGMHVSGIVGANDKEKKLYGVAPNAQILALKVFSDDLQYPTTFTDIWLKAMDDAISLGADVVNMSLGSSAGFSIEGEKYPETEMFEKARKAGIVVTVAAGNDGSITDGNVYGVKPLEGNFDTALIANPALDEGSFAAASMDNLRKYSRLIGWKDKTKGEVKEQADVVPGVGITESKLTGEWIELAEGREDDSSINKNIKGNFAVVELVNDTEGKEAFVKRLKKIVALEPSAIVFYNPESDPERIGRSISLGDEAGNITIVRIKRSTFLKMSAVNKASMRFKADIYMEETPVDNPSAGRISYFSSWGPTPDLRIKPEITAPGGSIYSTAEDDRYQNMSGTSMASPQVAGASAVIRQYMRENSIKVENPADFTKLLLMNTAKPVMYNEETPYFVRQQGSGALDLKNALETTVVVKAEGTNDDKADGKLEIKEVGEKKFRAKLTLENFGTESKTYSISTKAVYEPVTEGYRSETPAIVNSPQSFEGKKVTVAGNSTETVELDFDYTAADEIKINNFLEGFIELKEVDDETALSIPFLGFYGDWESERAIDAFQVKELDNDKRAVQFYVNKDADAASSMFMTSATLRLPVINNVLYFSPSSTYHKDVALRLAPLRNMEEIEYSILDGDTNETLRVIGKSLKVRKLNSLRRNRSFNIMPDSWWDGRIDGKLATEDINYIYQIRAKLNSGNSGGGNTEQIYRYPIRVDNTAPEIGENIELKNVDGKPRLKQIKFKVRDTGSGIEHIYLNSMKFAEPENKGNGNGSLLPPGVNLAPPGKKKPTVPKKTDLEGDSIQSLAEKEAAQGDKKSGRIDGLSDEDLKLGKPKFGKYLLLNFVDEEEKDGKVLPKVIDGKLTITEDMIPKNPSESNRIYVNRNGHRGKEIEVNTYYLADASHIYITVKDYLSNQRSISIRTGENKSYVSVGFLNFDNSMKDKKVQVYADGNLMTEPSYDTLNDKITFKLVMPDDKYHISMLYLKEGHSIKYLINDDKVKPDMKKELDYSYDRTARTMNFTIKNLKTGREIVTGFKEGPMPEEAAEKNIKLDISKMGPDNFDSIILNNNEVTAADKRVFNAKSGRIELEMRFNQAYRSKPKAVKKVIIHKKSGENVLLNPKEYFDLNSGAEGYNVAKNNFALYVYATVEDDAEIEVVYEGSEADRLSKPFGNDLFNDGYNGVNNTKTKYPVVFLESPSLMSVIPSNKDKTVNIEGFIGNVKKDDKVKSIEIKLVDEKGKALSEKIVLTGNEIKSMQKKYAYGGAAPYNGLGYAFSANLTVSKFCVNIRVEAVTEKGEKASIVRRAFYDLTDPVISYEVMDRELNSDSVSIKIHSSDDSLSLKLYNGDSLIDAADKTNVTMAEGGITLDKEIKIPLKPGQNKIKIRAVDLANFSAEKEISIYRTK